jgi:hypothetical protein
VGSSGIPRGVGNCIGGVDKGRLGEAGLWRRRSVVAMVRHTSLCQDASGDAKDRLQSSWQPPVLGDGLGCRREELGLKIRGEANQSEGGERGVPRSGIPEHNMSSRGSSSSKLGISSNFPSTEPYLDVKTSKNIEACSGNLRC